MEIKSLVDPEGGLIDRRIFSDRAIYELERERLFPRCWLYLGHESEIPRPGDFVAAYMGEEPIILWRGAGGRVGAYLNMCRHRGNRVCRADRGNAKVFTCSYHGWTYSSDGKLAIVPRAEAFHDLDRGQWGLIPVDRKSTRLNSSHLGISYAVFCLKKKKSMIKQFEFYPFQQIPSNTCRSFECFGKFFALDRYSIMIAFTFVRSLRRVPLLRPNTSR